MTPAFEDADEMLGNLSPAWSLARAEAELAKAFQSAGMEDPRREARRLLQGVLDVAAIAFVTNTEMALGASASRVADAVRRRLAHEPLSRIFGSKNFYGRAFAVTPDVLDPRPDTETVVDLALELLRKDGLSNQAIVIADIGTGSGILIATLLAELPQARGFASDISEAALDVARRNCERIGVSERVTFSSAPGLEGCRTPLDLVVSNPPYIRTGDLAGLDREVRDYDPNIALDGGSDGLDVYRTIASDVAKLSRPTCVVVEVGADQAADVKVIFQAVGAVPKSQKTDLGGHIRAVALEIHS